MAVIHVSKVRELHRLAVFLWMIDFDSTESLIFRGEILDFTENGSNALVIGFGEQRAGQILNYRRLAPARL